MPEKRSFPANEGDRPVGWQALRRGWNTNRVSAFPGGSQSNELPTGTGSDPYRKSSLLKTTSVDPLKRTADPCKPQTPPQGTDTFKSHTPLHRTGSVQPIRAIAPLCSSSQPSHIQTNSALTTLIPQNKAGFSSITISSRKVSRSASLPGSNTSESPSPPVAHQSMDEVNSRQVMVQRKATIVKVTEQRTMSSPSTTRAGTPTSSQALDTVVHRRKATIIKVTEHRESYSPAKAGAGTRHPEYRHSYTEGVYKENSMWSQGQHSQHNAAPSYHHLDPTKRPNSNTPTSDSEKNGGTLHRSTLSLFVSNPPAIAAAPAPSEVSPKAVGQRSDRPSRPLSCYGNMFGHTEPSKENVTQPTARKWSFGLPQETNINPVNSDSSFISRRAAVKEAGQLVADALKPNGGQKERLPPENTVRRASPCLTLIKAPGRFLCPTPDSLLVSTQAPFVSDLHFQRMAMSKYTPPLCHLCVLASSYYPHCSVLFWAELSGLISSFTFDVLLIIRLY